MRLDAPLASSSAPGARAVDAVPLPTESMCAPRIVTGPLALAPGILATIELCSQVCGNKATLAPLEGYFAVIYGWKGKDTADQYRW